MVVCCPQLPRMISENLGSCNLKGTLPHRRRHSCISIGDVGYIRNGRFHLLFSAARPLGDRKEGIDVPVGFEELTMRPPVFSLPRKPSCIRTEAVRRIGAYLGVTTSTIMYVPSLRRSITHSEGLSPRPLDPGAHFSFELTGTRGAALVTGHETYREDASSEPGKFKEYTKRHYESWDAFARIKMSGDVRPVRGRFRCDQGLRNGSVLGREYFS